MGFLNRGLLFLYTLFFGAISAGVVCLCLHLVPDRVFFNEYEYLVNQWQTPAVAGAVFLISLHLLLCCFDRSGNREVNAKDILLLQSEGGQINVSLSAIREMAERMAANVRGVRQARAATRVEHRKGQGDFLKLSMKLEVAQECSLQAVSDDLRQALRGYLAGNAGIEDVDIQIAVESIGGGVTVKKRQLH